MEHTDQKHRGLAKKTHELLMDIANTDSLTGLGNRRLFEQEYERMFNHAFRTSDTLRIILADVDKLKQINTDFGRSGGDEAIKIVGHVIKKIFRADDVPTRWGGDDFVVLTLENRGTKPLVLHNIQDRINSGILNEDENQTFSGRLTTTASVITWNMTDTKDELFRKVDQAVTLKKNNE
jgi:diguanylate cyclase (GGDEF)-like protein